MNGGYPLHGIHIDEAVPGSRLFIVCGKAADEELLAEAFQPFGRLQSIKLLRDKGVAYVKYDKASSAAAAMESLHETVLSDGRTKLKVMLAEAPHSRRTSGPRYNTELEMTTDPDNVPPRSRLFIVVPKNADSNLIQEELGRWPDLQYCKTDLISSKGVVFCKFARSSSALRALESITENGALVGYKVKCMLAEPKGKRGRTDSGGGSLDTGPSWAAADRSVASPSTSGSRGGAADFASATAFRDASRSHYPVGHTGLSPAHSRSFTSNLTEGRSLTPAQSAGFTGLGLGDYNMQHTLGNLSNIAQLGSLAALQGIASLAHANFAQGAALAHATQGLPQHQLAGAPHQHHNSASQPQHSGGAQQLQGAGLSGAPSEGSLGSLAAQMGLGGATGLGLGIGNMASVGRSVGLEALSLGSLGGLHVPAQGGHNAELSSAGSMSVCTTSGLRSSEPLNRQRLFVVCHKAATEDMLARLFRNWPGLDHLDLKRDRTTGQSKGFCYVNYNSREAAAAAMDTLNGAEWPPASGVRLKVMYAEPLGSRAPGSHRTPPPGSNSRPAPSDSLESAAHGLASPIAEDETSSRHRPLPTPDDPVLPSPPRFPLPTSIAEETGSGMYGADGSFGAMPRQQPEFAAAVGRMDPAQQAAYQQQAAQQQQHQQQAAHEAQQAQQAAHEAQQAQLQQLADRQVELHQQQVAELQAHQRQQQELQAARQQQQQPTPQPSPTLQQQMGGDNNGKTGRKQAAAAAPTTSDMNWESADAPGAEERRVYTTLPRPLPDYALSHVFSAYGAVDFVRLQSDPRYGVVQFATAEAAAAALTGLAGSDICGQALKLSATDPLQPERNSKRPRVAA